MKCNGCGSQLKGGELFCPYCGTEVERPAQPQQQAAPQQIHIHNHYQQQPERVVERVYVQQPYYVQPQQSQKSRLVMFLLWFFLGPFGGHQFYSGHSGKGILYLFTMGLCGVGVLIDFFVILLGNPRDQFGLPIKW